jgi:hypothetical protein
MEDVGTLVYTARAFGMDASQAMKNQIHRGLVELITNSDDAYGEATGDIVVNLLKGDEASPILVEVQDQASGLNIDEMISAFLKIGEKKSKLANGEMSRGLLGRGAKDVAVFGSITFSSIKAGKYSSVTIFDSGNYKINARDVEATKSHRERLGLEDNQSGLTATVSISATANVKVPETNKLREVLTNTAQLRDLVARRRVVVNDFRKPASNGVLVSSLPKGEEVLREEISIPGYSGVATLVVRKLPERQATSVTETSAHGILIKSGVSVFENTWFDLSGRTPSRVLAGELVAPQIIEVLRAELDSEDVVPLSILTRTRDGLERSHPLYVEISRQVSLACQAIFASIEREQQSNQKQGDKLSQDFKVAAQSIKSDVESILREIDDDPEEGPSGGSVSAFDAIPAAIRVGFSEDFTISLRADGTLIRQNLKVNSSSAELIAKGFDYAQSVSTEWQDHARIDGKSVTQLRFTAPAHSADVSLTFTLGAESATVFVMVREQIVQPEDPPTKLEFSQDLFKTSPGRGKNLRLRAPIDFVGEKIEISHTGTPIASCPASVNLSARADGHWAEAIVHVKTGLNTGKTYVSASSAKSAHEAKAQLNIEESKTGQGLKIDFELVGDRDPFVRYEVDQNGGAYICRVYGQHQGYAGIFGTYDTDAAKFKHEDSPQARAVLAQVIASAFAEFLVDREYTKNPLGVWDAPYTISRVKQRTDALISKLFRALDAKEDEG